MAQRFQERLRMRKLTEQIIAITVLFATNAFAMGGQPPGGGEAGGGLEMFVPLLLMFVVLYMFMIRPAQKKQKEKDAMLTALQKGDSVVTSGGIFGDIQQVKESSVVLRIADGVKIEVQRSSIGAIVEKGEEAENGESA